MATTSVRVGSLHRYVYICIYVYGYAFSESGPAN